MSAWTKYEEAFLAECAFAKIATVQIAVALERSAAVVRVRRHKLGLPPPKGADSYLMAERGLVSVAKIKRVVTEHFGIPLESMISNCREREITRPRQVAMFFAREMARKSYPRIGSMFGGRDHTTVIHAVRQVARRMGDDSDFNDEVSGLRALLVDNSHFDAFLENSAGS